MASPLSKKKKKIINFFFLNFNHIIFALICEIHWHRTLETSFSTRHPSYLMCLGTYIVYSAILPGHTHPYEIVGTFHESRVQFPAGHEKKKKRVLVRFPWLFFFPSDIDRPRLNSLWMYDPVTPKFQTKLIINDYHHRTSLVTLARTVADHVFAYLRNLRYRNKHHPVTLVKNETVEVLNARFLSFWCWTTLK